MKKYPLIIALSLLLVVTACGVCDNDNPTVTTETTVQTETTQTTSETTTIVTTTKATTVTEQPETTEKTMEVTMDNINEIFSYEYYDGNYEDFNRLFLYCFYDKPSEMDLRTILYHGMGKDFNNTMNELSEEEILSAGLDIEAVETMGAIKIPKDTLNDYLKKKTGLTIDEFENIDMKLKYNEQYDAYYGYRSTDTILQPINFKSVEMNGDVYTAVYIARDPIKYSEITCQVKFKVNDGVLQFISNKKIEAEE
ncbi:MAG: hypothetical protein IJA12_07665 [Oscillospiraceae bacterium]|nr:hypothetical protein [Oscillospiraceae bacterium]